LPLSHDRKRQATRPSARLAWEHTHREFLPALLFLHELQSRGLVGELNPVADIRPRHRHEVMFLPYYYDDRDREVYLRHGWRGHWLVNLSYEQMHFDCGRAYLLPDGEFARAHMLHCAWGPRYASLLEAHGIPAERIRLTGHLRFDIYHHRELLWPREHLARSYGLDPAKPWVLVPYNFNLAHVKQATLDSLRARKYALTDAFVDGVRRACTSMTELVRTLSERFPDCEFILRVHPAGFEKEALYRTHVRDNLHIIAEYDIANWIVQAALTVVWNSTSAMECLVAGRPVIAYEPEPFSSVYGYDVNRIIPSFTSVDDVSDLVGAVARGGDAGPLRYDWALFEQWYAHRDGRNVARLADVVEEAGRDFDRLACSLPQPSLKMAMRHLGSRFSASPGHPQPPDAALAQAAATLDVTPLAAFLR
jgi:surface carbohydrate biosynthesis protein